MRNFISKKWGTFKKSKALVFILGLIIGSTTIYIYLVGSQYLKWVNEGLRYTIELNRASAEVLPKGEQSLNRGEVVSAGSLQEVSLTIPAKGSIEELIAQYFGTDAEDAKKIMNCESSGNQFAFNPTNGSNDRGYWQISKKYHPEVSDDCAYDPTCSTEQAYRIFKERGWGEWACSGVLE